jgi:N-acetylneuraminate synthase
MAIFLIAEIGINHNGDLDIAKRLIAAAHQAGFDAVKFQKRSVEKVYTAEFLDSPRESPWGTTQRDQKMGLEFGREQYDEIDAYCRQLGIAWFASAWDVDSQLFLRAFDLPYNKVASAMLGNWPLLRAVAEERKKTFISTGMSTVDEIDEVVAFFRSMNCPFELMHCNSTYPMKEADANLRCIPMLRERYGCDVGYSGHETTLIKVCVAAVTLGATSLERHITLDRAMYGSDQAASISAHVLDDFVNSVRAVEGILGSGDKSIAPAEDAIRRKLRVEVPPDVMLT